jgi:GMP synthase-like glutamine amidotransferase
MIAAVINLGCPHSVTDYYQNDSLKRLYAYVAQVVRAGKPYLGICFGAQMLAHLLGAKVEHNRVKEIGVYRVRLTPEGQADPLFAGFEESFEVFHWHAETFRVPFGAQLLIEGDDCRNQAFRKGNLVGLQFHLEAGLEDVARWCDEYRAELDEAGKTREEILGRFEPISESMRQSNYRLLDNFFQLCRL